MYDTPNPEQAIAVAKLMAERSLTFDEAWSLVKITEQARQEEFRRQDIEEFERDLAEKRQWYGEDYDPFDQPSTIAPGVGQEDVLFRDGFDGSYHASLSGTPTSSQVGSIKYEAEGGTFAHRGILDPEEWVDWDAVGAGAEQRLLHSVEDIRYLFGRPKLTVDERKAKEYVEDGLLAIRDAGGNLTLLAKAFGWKIKANRTCKQMDSALARARSRRT